jgi:hypothetical protein
MQQAKEQNEGVGGANVEYEAETVIAEVTGVCTGAGHPRVFLEALAAVTATAGATTCTVRIRREGVGGTEVAKVEVTLTKSVKQTVAIQCNDAPAGEVANMTYVLTATSGAAEKQKSVSARIAATF